jgi:hypothetical protein
VGNTNESQMEVFTDKIFVGESIVVGEYIFIGTKERED